MAVFVVALTKEARRELESHDLAAILGERLEGQFEIVEKSFTGRSLVVEMPTGVAEQARFLLQRVATVEPETQLDLLGRVGPDV